MYSGLEFRAGSGEEGKGLIAERLVTIGTAHRRRTKTHSSQAERSLASIVQVCMFRNKRHLSEGIIIVAGYRNKGVSDRPAATTDVERDERMVCSQATHRSRTLAAIAACIIPHVEHSPMYRLD